MSKPELLWFYRLLLSGCNPGIELKREERSDAIYERDFSSRQRLLSSLEMPLARRGSNGTDSMELLRLPRHDCREILMCLGSRKLAVLVIALLDSDGIDAFSVHSSLDQGVWASVTVGE